MKRELFGTDGIRGKANLTITPELAFQLGAACGRKFHSDANGRKVALGRDTRRSGPMFAAALGAGLCAAGCNVVDLGVAPTGMLSKVAQKEEFFLAAVISASHNPAPDNGLKLLAEDGRKLSDEVEEELEQLMNQSWESRPTGADIGIIEHDTRILVEDYLGQLRALLPEALTGMKLLVDGANGAAFQLAPRVLRELGAEVVEVNCEPNGLNINDKCGATHPETVQRETVEHGCDLGIAFDGDADRAVFSDEKGVLINGDWTMAIWADHWHLEPPVVVGTVMSNGGFERYLNERDIQLSRADVGDKYVAQRILELGAKVGGEQSGHLIFPSRGVTGDGLITAIELLRVLKRTGQSASKWTSTFTQMPQVLYNVSVDNVRNWKKEPEILTVLQHAEGSLGDRGRINVRASGTQPMVRIMVEADSCELRDQAADQIYQVFENLGARLYSKVDLTNALGN